MSEDITTTDSGADTESIATDAVEQNGTGSLLSEEAEGTASGDPAAPDTTTDAAPAADPVSPAVPESYAFTGIDGLDSKDIDAFSGFAKSAGLNQQQAQAVLNLGLAQNKAAHESMTRQEQQWRAQIVAEPDIGGDNIRATAEYAKLALKHYGDDGEIHELLDRSGYGSNPKILRFLYNVGKSVSEDTPPNAGSSGKEELPLHERMYPNK